MEQAKRGAERMSGVSNVTYDLTAVFHNELDGLAALATYQQDAQSAGDQEAAQFFSQLQQEERQHVDALQQLLATRLQGGTPPSTGTAGRRS